MLKCRSLAAACFAALLSAGLMTPMTASAGEKIPVKTASLSKAVSLPSSDELELEGRAALAFQIETLEKMLVTLDGVSGYTADMLKQERIDGDLTGEQKIDLKFRHADDEQNIASSVYMKWRTGDRGRELIFVEGANGGKMLVHAGGWKARILPVLSLDPNGSLAMAESRHPITQAGLKALTQKWLDVRSSDESKSGIYFAVEPSTFDDQSCHKFIVKYARQSQSEIYRKCELWVDSERMIPLAAVNYTWGTDAGVDDGQTLVERYEYTNVTLDAELEDVDFDRANKRYAFRN